MLTWSFQVVNYLLGSLSRIFTTLQEVDDPLILYGFIAGFALNAILFLQVVYYWNAPASKKTESKKLEEPIAADQSLFPRAVGRSWIFSCFNTHLTCDSMTVLG